MSDISKINFGGKEYDIKDATARTEVAYLGEQIERVDGNKISVADKGVANGVATLDSSGKLAQHVVYSQVDGAPTTIGWDKVTGKPATYPVAGHTHTKAEVGLGNVDNTADANKRVSYAASAGNADTLDGLHESAFARSSHTHSYTSINGRPTGLDSGFVRTGQRPGTVIGDRATAEGSNTTASGMFAHAEGGNTTASGRWSHAEGASTTASFDYTHAEGSSTIASATAAHAEGDRTTASGHAAHAEGVSTTASGRFSHAGGYGTIAEGDYQTAIGQYNIANNSNSKLVIGGGNSNDIRKNIFRVTYNGVFGAGAYTSSGADYGEYFEWFDGNPENEDRIGYFVTLDGERIKIAQAGDYVLGVVSGTASIIGNGYEDQWKGMELHDVWGRTILEEYVEPAEYRELEQPDGTNERLCIRPETSSMRPKINPDYDSSSPYTPRSKRPEWDVIGMLGVLRVRDDGTCQVNGYCTVADGGIATTSAQGYRVLGRLADNIIKIKI